LKNTDFDGADLRGIRFPSSLCEQIKLSNTNLNGTDLRKANLKGVDLRNADLRKVDLWEADLSHSDLREADLANANMVRVKVKGAKISGSHIYAINVWDLEGEFAEQKDLIISPPGEPEITVDNIKVAQFIYLILNNIEIREVIDALTSKTVLILGRFSISERKTILNRLRDKLREYDLLPIVFEFDRPVDKDFTETIKTLAGLCYFVIADITNPKSSPLELQATVPDYQIPFVPIIQEGEAPFSMIANLQSKYDWMLDTLRYDSSDTLIEVLKDAVIDPAVEKYNQLKLLKAQSPRIRDASDFLRKGKA
jgi:hypothetical protein